jgi:hypothetical protein
MGTVPSLWTALTGLDAHLYLGSAPVGGGRAAVEAQGCGYPMTFIRVDSPNSALGVNSVYANQELGWSTLAELAALLRTAGPQLARMSDVARTLYERRFSRTEFVRVLHSITAA